MIINDFIGWPRIFLSPAEKYLKKVGRQKRNKRLLIAGAVVGSAIVARKAYKKYKAKKEGNKK